MHQTFSILYNANYEKFVRFACRYVRDSIVAEDITSDAFIYYWENRSRLPEDTNVEAYILTSIKNKCLSYLHHQCIHEHVISGMLSDMEWEFSNRIARLESFEPSEMYTREILELVDKTLKSMPEQTRRIFILSRCKCLSHKEIAEKLNISTKSVEFHITKTLRALRTELRDYFPMAVICLFLSR
ncbi:MAG: RNA polymerase sigma-70 factor [Tannerella sp.]|jgi:RNA polymerase sigma-70 factor (ECF subfamily)|nr:RNA polymerase sigma-70 factor [Tannerella sp.]